jgi:hypothetical protein
LFCYSVEIPSITPVRGIAPAIHWAPFCSGLDPIETGIE